MLVIRMVRGLSNISANQRTETSQKVGGQFPFKG